MNSSGINATSELCAGWVSPPSGRGTFEILWGCLFTNFLCSWAVLCLNVPVPGNGFCVMVKRKMMWMLCIIVGPEVALTLALGQYCSAKRSVADFKRLEKSGWTIEHGFFADMGGMVLTAPRWRADQVVVQETMTFPVNARQVHYLVEHGYLAFPSISKHTIRDKSKSDNFARSIIGVQAFWFIVQCVSRLAQHLPLTTLELSTTGVVLCTVPMFCCWFKKPSDVAQPIQLTTTTPIATMLIEAGEAAYRPYDRTPLDFVCTEDWNFDVFFNLGRETMTRWFKLDNVRPLDRFSTADFPPLEAWAKTVLICFEMMFGAVHLAGWNFHFPTRWERICWRVASCIFCGCCTHYWITDRWINYLRSRAKEYALEMGKDGDLSEAPDRWIIGVFSLKSMAPIEVTRKVSNSWETFTTAKFRTFPLPQQAAYFLPIGYGIIVVARLYTVVEVFASLRSVPRTIYDDVDWTKLIPHF